MGKCDVRPQVSQLLKLFLADRTGAHGNLNIVDFVISNLMKGGRQQRLVSVIIIIMFPFICGSQQRLVTIIIVISLFAVLSL